MNTPLQEKRIIAIDPTSRGFGFVVMEGPRQLIDWGVKSVKDNDDYRYSRRIEDLIDLYQPDVLIVENIMLKRSRRCDRVKKLIREIAVLALNKRIKVRYISRRMMKDCFSDMCGGKTKHQIAEYIAELLPELALRLPPIRKFWMSEDYRMAIFDAAAFALTFYHFEESAESK